MTRYLGKNTLQCVRCGKACIRNDWWVRNLGNYGSPVVCRSCASTTANNARPRRHHPIRLTCIDCGEVRFVHKISSLARRPLRCRSCASKATMTPERRQAQSERFRGSGSNFWNGGITPENKRLRETAEYREWRRAVFTRDAYTCQLCGLVGGKLHADHIKAFALEPALRFDVANGRTLCEPCHHRTDTWGYKANVRVRSRRKPVTA